MKEHAQSKKLAKNQLRDEEKNEVQQIRDELDELN
jgi:hypothetical protein